MLTGRYRYEALGHKPSFFQRARLLIDVSAYPNERDRDPFGSSRDLREEEATTSIPEEQPPPVPVKTGDFFSSLNWDKPTPPPPTSASPVPPSRPPVPPAPRVDAAIAAERDAGIRVQSEPESEDAHLYGFDCDKKETPILTTSRPSSAVDLDDLLDFNPRAAPSAPVPPARTTSAGVSDTFDPFGPPRATHAVSATNLGIGGTADLLGGFPTETVGISRNESAPSFKMDDLWGDIAKKPGGEANDPWAAFLNSTDTKAEAPKTASGGSTPKMQPRPNYSRGAFEGLTPGAKPKVAADAFGDLLSSQGFSAPTRENANKTLGDMRRVEENKSLDPVTIKVPCHVLLTFFSSLNDILWEGAGSYRQPSMGDLLAPEQVKKSYMRALLIIHPDRHQGEPHEQLANAIFGEVKDAYEFFTQGGQ